MGSAAATVIIFGAVIVFGAMALFRGRPAERRYTKDEDHD